MDKEAVGMEVQATIEHVLVPHAVIPVSMDWTRRLCEAVRHLAQQPAAQAAGLTDEEIDLIANTMPGGMAGFMRGWGWRNFARAIEGELLSRAAPSGEPVAYVECRECGRCGHTGINDAHSQDECCSNCDWTGPAPKEDVCPGCAQTGTMRAACPKCGSVYRLLCETTVGAATKPSAQQAEPGSPMKAAADALRRKAELEQAHQDGYRDGFKAAQAMLDKAEQPAEEARGVDANMEATLFEQHYRSKGWPQSYFIPHSGGHIRYGRAATQDAWEGWQARALLAAPAAGAAQDEPFGWASASNGNYFTRTERIAKRIGGLIPVYTKPQAATGAQGLTWISVNDRLPPIGTGERVLIYTEGADFAGEQFFDIKADDLYPTPDGEQDARTEVAAAATHWMPLPYPGITPNQKDA
ncbi:DUF551 domain-containing protein [Cupriavidus gilardii]|uniref:DUF551 domain-containing protein n=1 Tax=Cupriavidus gilardii TaxID=82541 RepID=UPI0021C0AD78|nr:DUF551 domain-containing protein [Cupriavidus gilardii]MCT9125369.1 DUF551 domain-containing protein [Cupriavidus gilardii]